MRRERIRIFSGGLIAVLLVWEGIGRDSPSLFIGSRLELFVDAFLIEKMEGVTFKLHPPKPAEIVLRFDKPWEGRTSGYVTVFQDGEIFRMYYRAQRDEHAPEFTAYAESQDGINWQKPSLGIFEFNGSRENNIVWGGEGTHNFAPFRDNNPAVPDSERYKAVGGRPLWAFVSTDGIRWKRLRDEPLLTKGAFDSLNTIFWDSERKQYVAYIRDFKNGVRSIRRTTSVNFVDWSEPEWLDFGDTPLEHFYTNAVIPYFRAPHIYLAFPKRFFPERKVVKDWPYSGISDAVFMASRDGRYWTRMFMEAFLRPGSDPANWTERNMQIAWGILQTSREELSIYWIEHYRHPDIRVRRGVLRLDGFVSLNAPYRGGEFVTKPLVFHGRRLIINFSTSAAGSIRVEIQDQEGRPIPGFTLADSQEIYGDSIAHVVSWRSGFDVGRFQGSPIRLRFVMKDADLYSISFQP
ncbi:MAG: hypothetical protein N0A16_12865 [Blastocatellia bacterium]|nr:hypothetical protein [Blastocatellia bacterium]MDW8169271.1 hypothetical protein [Acidobacteriota bacterium]